MTGSGPGIGQAPDLVQDRPRTRYRTGPEPGTGQTPDPVQDRPRTWYRTGPGTGTGQAPTWYRKGSGQAPDRPRTRYRTGPGQAPDLVQDRPRTGPGPGTGQAYRRWSKSQREASQQRRSSKFKFSSVQNGIYTLGKTHMCSTPSLRSVPSVAFETVASLTPLSTRRSMV